MTCDGHIGHYYEPGDCLHCGHPREEHDAEGYWPEDRGERPIEDAEAAEMEASRI